MTSVFHWKIYATVFLRFIAGKWHGSVNISKTKKYSKQLLAHISQERFYWILNVKNVLVLNVAESTGSVNICIFRTEPGSKKKCCWPVSHSSSPMGRFYCWYAVCYVWCQHRTRIHVCGKSDFVHFIKTTTN